MPVKEYCLIPKAEYEINKSSSSHQPNLHASAIVTPQPRVEATIVEDNSSLEDTVKILLNPKDYQYAEGILSFLRKHPLIRWDKSGNMLSPIRDVNIIDIIRYWVNRNAIFDPDKISDLRMMVKLVDIPDSFINPLASGGFRTESVSETAVFA